MNFDLGQIFFVGLGYLCILFGIAYLVESNPRVRRLTHHPLVYILSLGVITGAWAFYGMVDMAARYGYSYLSYFFGISALFLFGSLILSPMQRIARLNQLRSLADMLAFRYRSQWAGISLTVVMLLVMLPLFALQITAVSDTVLILTNSSFELFPGDQRQSGLAFGFCCLIILFTVLFGARHVGTEERHDGLIAAIAFESLTKLTVLLTIAGVCIVQVFGGFDGLSSWLLTQKNSLLSPSLNNSTAEVRYFLLLFFMAAVLMPHSFHMMFSERPTEQATRQASWGFPLYLLLLSLPVLIILWAAQSLGIGVPTQYATLGIGISLNAPQLELLAYIGGLSAASSTIIVATLALASMCLNHLVLAVYQPDTADIYRWLLWMRRVLIVGIILMSYLFYRIVNVQHDLASLGIAAFSGALQFMPGVLAMLYWPEANRTGFVAGLLAGFSLWAYTVLLPLLQPDTSLLTNVFMPAELQLLPAWHTGTLAALGVNILVFIIASLLFSQSEEEIMAAEICSLDELSRPVRQALDVHSPAEMKDRLTAAIGASTAERELSNALKDLGMEPTESRPYALRRLREQVEANLSGLLGPSTAYEIINRHLPYSRTQLRATEDIQFIESRVEDFQTELTGLAAEMDSLRRYHRQTLQALPVGVCIVGADGEVTMWNSAMVELTNIQADTVLGSAVHGIDQPWSDVLTDFTESTHHHRYKQHVVDQGQDRWVSLHKTYLHPEDPAQSSQAIVIEDLTETQILEQELAHSERLASVGRLAAGVAHEIGNPVTGIACIAQNLVSEHQGTDIADSSSEILNQTKRVSRIVQSLVNFSRTGNDPEEQEFAAVKLRDCIDDAINLLLLNKEARTVNFEVSVAADMLTNGDNQRLAQVFVNLLANARDASDEGATINIHAIQEDYSLLVTVEDFGKGIPRDVQEQIFEPFFTTKEPGEGTGLGLSLVYSIVEDHAGSIHIESPVNPITARGTRFVLKLPRHMRYN